MTEVNNESYISMLRLAIEYSPSSGSLVWLERCRDMFDSDRIHKSWNTKWAGKPALNSEDDGYLKGNFMGAKLSAHRAAWMVCHGDIPDGKQIDHINGDRKDNRIENLRLVEPIENSHNMKMSSKNTSGYTGVCWVSHLSKWNARISVNGKRIALGCYESQGDAISARRLAERTYGFHPNHGRKNACA